ncbi:nuclease-like protein [Fonticella tunisiensis]|uniref:Nuclease-like protein n=2 Tax=Fonticella tunisiensis TaxID=1096341 RepID=A0A4R7K7Q3_9CLOT|nr:nuclease-like protein [Fonticella tunisiensis]
MGGCTMKDLLKFIPGFRSGKKWKMIIASIYYLIGLTAIFDSVWTFLSVFILPFFIFGLVDLIKATKNKSDRALKRKSAAKFALALLILLVVGNNMPSAEVIDHKSEKQEVKVENKEQVSQEVANQTSINTNKDNTAANNDGTYNSSDSINNTAAAGVTISDQQSNASQPAEIQSPILLTKGTVTRVVDGDTAEININGKTYKVRFIGVNTPESTTRVEPYGKEASNYTKSKLTGKTVYLEKDVSETDRYGRLLRYIWLQPPTQINDKEIRSKMFNAILVLDGQAQAATYPPDVKYADYFRKYTAEAREKNIGLWAISSGSGSSGVAGSSSSTNSSGTGKSSGLSSTSDSGKVYVDANGRGLIKGNISSSGEKIYHMPGGAYYNRTVAGEWFKTEAEAQAAGYRRSKR